MLDYREFKTRNNMKLFLHSVIYLNNIKGTEKIKLYPDVCDYLLFSSRGYYRVIKKTSSVQFIDISYERLILFRLNSYTYNFIMKFNKNFIYNMDIFQDFIFTTSSISKQLSFFNYCFLEDLYVKIEPFSLEINICQKIYNTRGDIKLSAFESEYNVTKRTIQRKFKTLINLTPKEYLGLIRFQSEIIKINFIKFKKHKNYPKYFTDYSHYYKFFYKYSNTTPKLFFNNKDNIIKSIYDSH